ncbi:ABC transporter ATP-binding protein [Actinokineospora auranticolor]|nr:ABC transporter ATP-binding protein [Actinokineospora auranticolor]
MSDVVAEVHDLGKVHGGGSARVVALDGVTAAFRKGEFTAVMGPSGSGKSTLLHCLAGLDTPTSGAVRVGGTDLSTLDDDRLTRLRRERIGFVFQSFNLVPTLTAWENITLPLTMGGVRPDRDWVEGIVAAVGLSDRLHHRPAELSGGQQQRVACARAMATRPDIIVADEPTGNLDTRSGAAVLGLLAGCARQWNQAVLMVTHDPMAAAHTDRILFLTDGRLADEMPAPTADRVLDRMRDLDPEAAHG